MSISQNFPTIRPTLNLNFARSKTLDPRITFTRASTATYVDEDGLIKTAAADEARFDYDPTTGESLGLLIEESRTNYISNESVTFSLGDDQTTVTPNAFTAPDGSNTAIRIQASNSFVNIVGGRGSVPAGSTLTASFYVYSAVEIPTCRSRVTYGSGSFDTIKTIPAGKWTRFVCDAIVDDTGSDTNFSWRPLTAINSFGVLSIDCYIWGFQVEASSFPTSYIPTSGSTVTRQPDNAQITGTNFTDWYNSSEGTIFTESNIYSLENLQNFTEFQIDDGTQTNRIFHYLARSNDSAKFQAWGIDVGVQDNSAIANTDLKHASSYNSSSYITCLNSSLSSTGTTGTQVALNEAHIGWNHSGNYLNGHIKQLIYYPARISDIKLEQMTKNY